MFGYVWVNILTLPTLRVSARGKHYHTFTLTLIPTPPISTPRNTACDSNSHMEYESVHIGLKYLPSAYHSTNFVAHNTHTHTQTTPNDQYTQAVIITATQVLGYKAEKITCQYVSSIGEHAMRAERGIKQ